MKKSTGTLLALFAFLVSSAAQAAPKTNVAAAMPKSAMNVECENLGPSNDVCIFADDASVAQSSEQKPNQKLEQKPGEAQKPVGLRMALADDLTGGALDIENEFAANTALADATEVTESNEIPESVALEQAFRAQDQVNFVQNYLHSISGPAISGRVSESGRP